MNEADFSYHDTCKPSSLAGLSLNTLVSISYFLHDLCKADTGVVMFIYNLKTKN